MSFHNIANILVMSPKLDKWNEIMKRSYSLQIWPYPIKILGVLYIYLLGALNLSTWKVGVSYFCWFLCVTTSQAFRRWGAERGVFVPSVKIWKKYVCRWLPPKVKKWMNYLSLRPFKTLQFSFKVLNNKKYVKQHKFYRKIVQNHVLNKNLY